MMDMDGKLFVHSIFDTIQGEGPDAGRPAIFVRLARCNLRCYFCDTEFERGAMHAVDVLLDMIARIAKTRSRELVVITGGEPLLQNIVPFVRGLNSLGIAASVETAGTCFYPELRELFDAHRSPGRENLIVCSPKTPKIADGLEEIVGAWKYIVRQGSVAEDGLPNASTQIEGRASRIFRPSFPSVPIYVQAMDELDETKNANNLQAAVRASLEHGYRLTVQMHKLAGLE